MVGPDRRRLLPGPGYLVSGRSHPMRLLTIDPADQPAHRPAQREPEPIEARHQQTNEDTFVQGLLHDSTLTN